MIILKELHIKQNKKLRKILFGIAETETEKSEVFALRFRVYSERGYIDASKYANNHEIDKYDHNPETKYFIAVLVDNADKKLIGCVRLIRTVPLPTQEDFIFDEPFHIKSIPTEKRFEIGRLIVIPPNKETKDYLPRGIVMLFFLHMIGNYALEHGLEGGYAFIKKSLEKKLIKSGFPLQYIENYKHCYPSDCVLYRYFNQKEDPVLPIYFISKSFLQYSDKLLKNRLIFKKSGDKVFLRNNIITDVLRILKIV